MLLASKFDDELPHKLKSFVNALIEKHHNELKNWLGQSLELEGVDDLVLSIFKEYLEET